MKTPLRLWPSLTAPIVTLSMSFGWTESNDTFKLLALGVAAGFALASVSLTKLNLFKAFLPLEVIAGSFFLCCLFIPLIFYDAPIAQQIYGVSGRNLGLLHYVFLTLVLLGVSILNPRVIVPKVLKSLVIVGILESGYGALQYFGFDFASWNNPENWIFGSFGNPNYLSSFLALSGIATIHRMLVEKKHTIKSLYCLIVLFEGWVIILTGSIQGLVLLVVGLFSLAVILIYSRSKNMGRVAVLLGLQLGLVSVLGIFQIGPLSRLLYQDSVAYRGDYWRAGLRMFKDNWVHGVGLDSYGDYYRMYRDYTSVTRRGVDVVSNSAHNLFIDLAATGGIFLLLGYLLIITLVLFSVIKKFRSSASASLEYKFLVILWFAFNLQTLISINVPSLAIWGWIFSGLIISFDSKSGNLKSSHKSPRRKTSLKSLHVIAGCCSLCLILVVPLIVRDVNFAKALAKNDITDISRALLIFPKEADQMAGIAIAYSKLGRSKESLDLALSAILENPNSARAWRIIFESSTSTEQNKIESLEALSRLDPYYSVSANS
jgi:O-antigen ligase